MRAAFRIFGLLWVLVNAVAHANCGDSMAAQELKKLLEESLSASATQRIELIAVFRSRLQKFREVFEQNLQSLPPRQREQAWRAWWENLLDEAPTDVVRAVQPKPMQRAKPGKVISLNSVLKDVVWSAGGDVANFLLADGTLECFAAPSSLEAFCPGGTKRTTLAGVNSIHGLLSSASFVALRSDGSLTCWGRAFKSYPCPVTQGIRSIVTNESAFAGINAEGKLICGGDPAHGGECGPYRNIVQVVASRGGFSFLNTEGDVFTWGMIDQRGWLPLELKNPIVSIEAGINAFVGIKKDGTAQCWGHAPSTERSEGLKDLKSIVSTYSAFAALQPEGKVRCWGFSDPSIALDHTARDCPPDLKDVKELYSLEYAFIALHTNGTLTCWGLKSQCPKGAEFSKVDRIVTNSFAGAAVLNDGSVRCWGSEEHGGDCAFARHEKIRLLRSIGRGFIAQTVSGGILLWPEVKVGQAKSVILEALQDRVESQAIQQNLRAKPSP